MLIFNRMLFPALRWASDDGGQGGGNSPADADDDKTPETETTPENSGDSGGGSDERTFTQADIDRIVQDRVKRAKQSGVNDVLEKLGVESLDDLEAAYKAHKEREDAEKSEVERLNDRVERLQKDKADLMAQVQQEQEKRHTILREQALRSVAKSASDPEDVILWAKANQAEAFSAIVDEDGKVDSKAAEKIAEECKKAKPHYFGATAPGSPSNRDGKVPQKDVDKVIGKRPLTRL